MMYPLFKNLILTSVVLLNTATSIAETPSKVSNTGLSASMKMTMSNARINFSSFVFDTSFNLKTKGAVGKNGKAGNVSAASISGINTLPSGTGTLTLTKKVTNEVDATHIESTNTKLGFEDKILSFGTASPAEFSQLHQYKGLYGTSGLWMHYSGDCITCPVVVTNGMFIEGSPTPRKVTIKSLPSTEGIEIFPTFKGVLDGMPEISESDCEGECEAGLKAVLMTQPSTIDKTVVFKTINSFIHYEDKSKGLKRIVKRPDLNITGTLVFDSDSNLFKGAIKDGRGVKGTAMGRYYGHAHNEIGIVYTLGKPSAKSTEMGVIYGVRYGGTNQ